MNDDSITYHRNLKERNSFNDSRLKSAPNIGVYFSKDKSEEEKNLVFKVNTQIEESQHPNVNENLSVIKLNPEENKNGISNNEDDENESKDDDSLLVEQINDKSITNKKSNSWYKILKTGYLSRQIEFKRLFKDIPKSDRLIAVYSCALQKNILVQGRMFISQHWISFYSNIFGVETSVVLKLNDIKQIAKDKTAHLFSNAMHIYTVDEKYTFSSLNSRDKTMLILYHVWNLNITDQTLSLAETWFLIHHIYGRIADVEKEEGYELPGEDVEAQMQCKLQAELLYLQSVDSVGLSASEKECLEKNDETETRVSSNENFTIDSSPQKPIPSHNLENTLKNSSSASDSFNIKAIDEVFNCSVDQLFKFLFSDSVVFKKFVDAKNTNNVVLTDWQYSNDGRKLRKLTYNLMISVALKTRSAPTVENQIMHESSKPGYFYLIDCECTSEGVPYSDNFYVVSRYCLRQVEQNKTHLAISSKIVYRKNVWSVMKSFIDKNATTGIMESFKLMGEIINVELGMSLPKDSTKTNDNANNSSKNPQFEARDVSSFKLSTSKDATIHILFFIIISLLISNAYFFSRINCTDKLSSEIISSASSHCNIGTQDNLNEALKRSFFLKTLKEVKTLSIELNKKIKILEDNGP